jgi:glycosyltransferase involved in cell wall biosynthesis
MSGAGYRPCVVIPVYNHRNTVRATVASVAGYGVPVYLVDDGSDEATREELVRIGGEFALVRLSRLPRNSGKGSAVIVAMQRARAEGMTHALQIDADGQHDVRDVPRFLERGELNPEAVICGQPVFDDSAPRSRRYGRYISHFWVWVETLSFAIKDAMCGFRLYPLHATGELIERGLIPLRMDFDIAIVVRLAWRGVPVENLSTRVVYPAGGLSHFDRVRDNLRISRTHARLLCGMLLRLPLLLWRRLAPAAPRP